jgi:hypothetical protein
MSGDATDYATSITTGGPLVHRLGTMISYSKWFSLLASDGVKTFSSLNKERLIVFDSCELLLCLDVRLEVVV